MDARQVRTREMLAASIVELARTRPLSDISVTDVARHAGISRPTFYAHAESPGDLLAAVLGVQLETLRAELDAGEAVPRGAWVEAFQRTMVDHVYRNKAIYRPNLRQRLPHQLRDALIDHIERGLLEHLVQNPDIAPTEAVADNEFRYREASLYAAIAASGTVAALETWLRAPDPIHPEWAVHAILRGIAEWWTTN